MRGLWLVVLISVAAEAQESRARFFDRVCPRTPGGRSTRGLGCDTGAFFEFAPASGAGLPSAQSLCSVAAQHFSGKDVSWCTNGDGTAASGTTLSVATEQGTVTETTQQVCPNGLDCAAVAVLRPTTATSGYTEATNVNRSASVTAGSFTACVAFVHELAAITNSLSALYSVGATTGKYALQTLTNGLPQFNFSTAACGGVGANINGGAALEPGSANVICGTWAASDGIYRLYTNGVADGTSASFTTICGGNSTSRFSLSGAWVSGAITNAPTTGGVLGAFYVDTTTGNGGQLSAAEILALSNAVLARGPTGTKGEALTFARASPRACESSTGLGSMVPTNVPCMAKNGYNGWPLGTVISARSNELDNPYWTATAAVTANQARSFDGTLSADQLSDVSAAASQGVLTAIASTSATQHTFSCFVSAGTATSATISMAGTGSATGDCSSSVTGLTSTGQWISCTSPAAYAGTLTVVTPSLVVGDTVGVTGTIFASYCNHTTTAPARSPAIRTVAAGATRAIDPGLATTLGSAVGVDFCLAASFQADSATAPLGNFVQLGPAGVSEVVLYRNTDTTAGYDIATTLTTPAVAAMGVTVHRSWLSDSAGTSAARWDQGVVAAPAPSMAGGQTAFTIGASVAGSVPAAGTVSRVQIDPSPTRCTP